MYSFLQRTDKEVLEDLVTYWKQHAYLEIIFDHICDCTSVQHHIEAVT